MSEQPLNEHAIHEEENKLIAQRKEKLAAVREQGNAFPNDFRRDSYCADLQKANAMARARKSWKLPPFRSRLPDASCSTAVRSWCCRT